LPGREHDWREAAYQLTTPQQQVIVGHSGCDRFRGMTGTMTLFAAFDQRSRAG
jgi:hypothetical protein